MTTIDQVEGHGPSLASAYKPPTPVRSLRRSISQQLKKSISLTSEDMRAFSLKGRHAVNFSLSGVGRPSLFGPRRSSPSAVPVSEPVSPQRTPSVLPAVSDGPEAVPPPVPKTDDSFEISVEKATPRSPSPTPTEVLEPEPEDIVEQLQKQDIRIRDFAYEQSSSRTPIEEDPDNPFSTITTASTSSPAPQHQPAAEIFDQYKGIVEYEFRLAQTPRTIPITGKVLRRLLDIRWVTMEEAKSRLHQMDWEAMKIYEAKSADYPWRPCKWTTIPDTAARAQLLAERANWFMMVDRMRAQMEAHAAWEAVQAEMDRRAVEEAQERIRQMEAERQGGMGMVVDPTQEPVEEPLVNGYAPLDALSTDAAPIPINGTSSPQRSPTPEDPSASPSAKKRSLEHSISTPSFSQGPSTSTGPKRVRLATKEKPLPSLPTIPGSTDNTPIIPSLNASPSRKGAYMLPPGLTPPTQQYPAPLSTYDPQKYPDAARVIQETRAMVTSQDEDQAREDTPPLEDDDGENVGSSWKSLGKIRGGQPLQRKRKGHERSLSRTQTYSQFS